MSSINWMNKLASHFKLIREEKSGGDLIVLFDIDGTILDRRHMIRHVLTEYDRLKGTSHFNGVKVEDINVHENQLNELLESLGLDHNQQAKILQFYENHRRTNPAVMEAHRPFRGVMDVIRWFQLQSNTHVGLNTGRPESRRNQTLEALNRLGKEYKVQFSNNLLHMRNDDSDSSVPESKVQGIKEFQKRGYRVIAMVDNEPKNLAAIAQADFTSEILLLHADTIFETRERNLPEETVRGSNYEITDLIQEHSRPEHIHFVWDGVNRKEDLRSFLNSRIHWGKADLRTNPNTGDMLLRTKSFDEKPLLERQDELSINECLEAFNRENRGIIVNLDIREKQISGILSKFENSKLSDSQLGFSFEIGRFERETIRLIRKRFPDSRLQTSIDFLSSMILSEPQKAKSILELYQREWELDQYTISWQLYQKRKILRTLQDWDFNVNIENVPGLERFLQAALLLPYSVTVDFGQETHEPTSSGPTNTPNPDIPTPG